MTTGPQDEAAGLGQLGAGHADREQVVSELKTAYVDGRLTKTELVTRTGLALAAQTYADLDAATAGLPAEPIVEAATAVPATDGPLAARPVASPVRWPLAKAAAGASVFLLIAAACIPVMNYFDPDSPGPHPHHSWAAPFFLLFFLCLMAAAMTLFLGTAISVQQRLTRRRARRVTAD